MEAVPKKFYFDMTKDVKLAPILTMAEIINESDKIYAW